jgi:iron-sulfur cluster repair protein YtfE (RIC family)
MARPPQRSPFEHFHTGLLQVHRELQHAVAEILAATSRERTNRIAVNHMLAAFCAELENHHRSEDVFFFPAFRTAGRLRSTDIAFLDARDDEHLALVRLVGELKELTRRTPPNWGGTVRHLLAEVAQIADPHFAAEESVLTPRHVAEMITQRQLGEVYRDMGQNWNRR